MGAGGRNIVYDIEAPDRAPYSALVAALTQAQNPDGGWSYRSGTSWTEPTVLALLALSGSPLCARGYAWLAGRQRPDGGWTPQPQVDETTWVTSLVALLPPDLLGPQRYRRAIHWILEQTSEDSTLWYRIRQRLLGGAGEQYPGWPWFPGTAAWVTPTSLAILALRKFEKLGPSDAARRRIQKGQDFLLSRMCADGGWNHGSSRALGYDGESYPETTGVALLALAGVQNLDRAIAAAERHWQNCRSAEAAAWLKLGFHAQGRPIPGWPPDVKPRNIRDKALCILADMSDKDQNAFL